MIRNLRIPPMKIFCFYSLCVLCASLAFSNALVEISFVAALLFWLMWKIQERKIFFIRMPRTIYAPLFLYLIVCTASFYWSEYPENSFRGVFKVFQHFLIFLMAAETFRRPKDRHRFEIIFAVCFLILTIDGFYQLFSGYDFLRKFPAQHSSAGYRVSASFKSYGLFASFLICTVPYLFALGMKDYRVKSEEKISYWILPIAVAGAALLVLTRSRGGILAFVIGLIALLIYLRKFRILSLVGLALIALFFLIPRDMIIHRDIENKEQSLIERCYLWDRAVSVIRARPLTGTGINTYAVAHQKYDKEKNWRVRNYYAHNGYLQVAAETGVPSLIFLLWFLFAYFHRSFRRLPQYRDPWDRAIRAGLLLGLINFLIFTAFDTVFHNAQAVMVFWFLLGLQWAYTGTPSKSAGFS